MNVLVIGSGGREHALAWKLAQSARVARVFVAPGNGGTAGTGAIRNVPHGEKDVAELIAFARANEVGLTVVGPEAPLADGLVDAFEAAGLRCFGPSGAAARLEASKAFAKAFMARHDIPTGRYRVFTGFEEACEHLREVDYPVVIKASGLAAGKGVIVTDDVDEAEDALRRLMVERVFGAAGEEVLVEERLFGEEATVMALCDGQRLCLLPPSQDHKAVFEGDRGPNTGGMGAYAPAPIITEDLLAEVVETVLRPTIDGMRMEGRKYVGVLYAGLMVTADGPKVLEYNCRFGDPETQVVLPLLDGDLVDVMEACLAGTLTDEAVRWHEGSAATVVAASAGYPGSYPTGRPIRGAGDAGATEGVHVFHAGTRVSASGGWETSGGRVLAVTGLGADLPAALQRAYGGLEQIWFEGMHFRRDIGAKALKT